MRIAVASTIFVFVVLVGYYLFSETRERAVPSDYQPKIVPVPDTTAEVPLDIERQATTPVATPIEIIGSIYDQDFEYSTRASAAADETMAHYPHEAFLRWWPVHIDPLVVLRKGYLSQDAMPSTLSLTLFPDLSFVVDQTGFTVMKQIDAAIWNGFIRDTQAGRAEVSINGGEEAPNFTIRLFDYPNAYSILQSASMPDVYIAIEWATNPDMKFD